MHNVLATSDPAEEETGRFEWSAGRPQPPLEWDPKQQLDFGFLTFHGDDGSDDYDGTDGRIDFDPFLGLSSATVGGQQLYNRAASSSASSGPPATTPEKGGSASDGGPAMIEKQERVEWRGKRKRGADAPPGGHAPPVSSSIDTSTNEDRSAVAAVARAKEAHSVVERRYRDNLNGKIVQLHRLLVLTAASSGRGGGGCRQSGGKSRKEDILTGAMDYIRRSEHERDRKADQIGHLRDWVRSLEQMARFRLAQMGTPMF